METHEKNGLTWTEMFVVVVLLGIFSAMAVPRFSRASQQARLNDLISDLQEVRSQMELYRIQHRDRFPGQAEACGQVDRELFLKELTTRGDDDLGPYLQQIPRNAYNNLDTITFVSDPAARPTGTEGTGWWFNGATGQFRACDCAENTRY
jgi:general secretion pathway protein G